MLKRGGRHGQLVTKRSFSMGPLAHTPQRHPNQPRIGWVGAESSRGLRSGCVLWCEFFRIMVGGGVLRLH